MSEQMKETTFLVPKMDCPSEERLTRLALDSDTTVVDLHFDLDARTLRVTHRGDGEGLLARLEPLSLGARRVGTAAASGAPTRTQDPLAEARVLRTLLAINGGMFVGELVLGFIAQSTGLLADSVDMFADAAVYALALHGVGRPVAAQHRAAAASGYLQLALGLGVLAEVLRRGVVGGEPIAPLMMAVSMAALVANVTCMALLAKHRTGGVHLRASWIFSTNDVLANLGVMLAGGLVAATGSGVPDLVIGTAIGFLVLGGAVRILRMARR